MWLEQGLGEGGSHFPQSVLLSVAIFSKHHVNLSGETPHALSLPAPVPKSHASYFGQREKALDQLSAWVASQGKFIPRLAALRVVFHEPAGHQ